MYITSTCCVQIKMKMVEYFTNKSLTFTAIARNHENVGQAPLALSASNIRNPKLYEGRCVWNGGGGGSGREAITLRVVLVKKFSTLPFTVKNMKLCTNN